MIKSNIHGQYSNCLKSFNFYLSRTYSLTKWIGPTSLKLVSDTLPLYLSGLSRYSGLTNSLNSHLKIFFYQKLNDMQICNVTFS